MSARTPPTVIHDADEVAIRAKKFISANSTAPSAIHPSAAAPWLAGLALLTSLAGRASLAWRAAKPRE